MTRIVSVCALVIVFFLYSIGRLVVENPSWMKFLPFYNLARNSVDNQILVDFVISHDQQSKGSINGRREGKKYLHEHKQTADVESYTSQSVSRTNQLKSELFSLETFLEKSKQDKSDSKGEGGIVNTVPSSSKRKESMEKHKNSVAVEPSSSQSGYDRHKQKHDVLKASSSSRPNKPLGKHTYSGTVEVYSSRSGFGNNLYGLVSAFVVAALTNRRLVGVKNYVFHNLFNVTDYWGSPIQYLKSFPGKHRGLVQYNQCFKNTSQTARKFSTSSLSSIFPDRDIIISTNCPFFYFIVQNSKNQAKLIEMGLLSESTKDPSVQAFFLLSHILRTYIIPHPDILSEVDQYLSRYAGKRLIGMHIRCGMPLSDFKDQSTFLKLDDISTFQQCAKGMKLKSNTVLVVGSDSTRVKNIIQSYNPSIEVVFQAEKAMHTMTGTFRQVKVMQTRSALIEMLILSRCDELIGTKRSTYSICAAAFMGSLPHLVGFKSKKCIVPKTIVFGYSV